MAKSEKGSSGGSEDMVKSEKGSCVGGEDDAKSRNYSGEDRPSLLCPHIIPLKKGHKDVLKVVSGPNVNTALGKIVFPKGRFHEKYIRYIFIL